MATLIPNRGPCAGRMTPGERCFSLRLEDKLEGDCLCWYDVPVGPGYRHPDFIVLHPHRGILVPEVEGLEARVPGASHHGKGPMVEQVRGVIENAGRQLAA